MNRYIALSVSIGFLLLPGISRAGRRKLTIIDNQKFLEICQEYTESNNPILMNNDRGRYATLHSEEGSITGYFLITSDYARSRGYHGATAVGLTLDIDGTILSARIVESTDTKRYVDRIQEEGFLDGFSGLPVSSPPEIDTISGATRTCDAIRDSIRNTLKIFKATIIQSD